MLRNIENFDLFLISYISKRINLEETFWKERFEKILHLIKVPAKIDNI